MSMNKFVLIYVKLNFLNSLNSTNLHGRIRANVIKRSWQSTIKGDW